MSKKLFNKNGFLNKKSFLSATEVSIIKNNFVAKLSKYIKLEKADFINLFENESLHRKIIHFREIDSKGFGDFYDELKLSSEMKSIFYKRKFLKLFSDILGIDKNMIYINGFMFRLDAPYDNRNRLEWHQDSPYYMQTSPEFNSLVCWLPITNNTSKNGTIQFIPKSHKKYIPAKKVLASKSKKNKFSKQFNTAPNVEEIKRLKNFSATLGSVGLFHMNLIHRSGVNSSNKMRLSIACRVHDISKKFNIGTEVYIYNKSGKKDLN